MADRGPGSGRPLAGRYELGDLLGAGGMASVFRGTDQVLGRPVAVKVLHPRFAEDPRFLERFRREARMAATLAHPNIVAVYDAGTDDGAPYIVMEYVEGRTLDAVVAEEPLTPQRAAEIGAEVSDALQAAHQKGLIHRDVKPGNIMLTPEGRAKVMDFGIARATTHDTLTQTATVLGTAAYLSPEQARGDRLDHRSDLYSLGCTLYAVLAGEPPFTGDNPVAVATRHLSGEPPPLSRARGDVPAPLEAVVMRALAKDPDQRFPDAAAMGTALREAVTGEILPPTRPLPAAPAPGPRRWLFPAVLLAIALVAALLASLVFRDGEPVMRAEPGQEAEATPGEPGEEQNPTPSPEAEEPQDAVAAAFAGLVQVVGDGVAAGEVTEEAEKKILEGAQKVLEEFRKGEVEKALDELDKLREETGKLFEEGQIASEERFAQIAGALDALESAIRSAAPAEEEDEEGGPPGGGPPGGEPPGRGEEDD